MSLRAYDYRCGLCGWIGEALIEYADRDNVACPNCQAQLTREWRKAPGVRGEENLSREERQAARNPVVAGGKGRIDPFTGTTRTEYRNWLAKNNISPVERSEVQSRNTEVNTGPTPMQKARREHLRVVVPEVVEKVRQGFTPQLETPDGDAAVAADAALRRAAVNE